MNTSSVGSLNLCFYLVPTKGCRPADSQATIELLKKERGATFNRVHPDKSGVIYATRKPLTDDEVEFMELKPVAKELCAV